MTITLTETYRHLDGTPGSGYVLVRTVTPFHDGQGTVLGEWVSYPLASDGSVSIVIDADLEHADPGPQWLQIMEQITCQRGGVWEIGPDVLFATTDPTIELGTVRQLPAITADAPRYIPVPGPIGPTGPTGPTGPATAVTVDGVDALPQGDQPTVTDTDPGPDVALRFGIPTGGVTFADFMGMTPVDYDPTASYAVDDIVRFNGALWVVKRAIGPGEDPTVKPGSWQNMMLDDVANKARNAQNGLAGKVDKAGDTMTGPLVVPAPAADRQVPRLARTPDPTTGDLGLPGFAGSDTGWRDVTADLQNGWGVEAGGAAYVRRVGYDVFFHVYRISQPGTDQTVYAWPIGFRYGLKYGVTHWFSTIAANENDTGQAISGNKVNVPTSWTAGSTARQVITSGSTTDDWPSTLPGSELTPPATWS